MQDVPTTSDIRAYEALALFGRLLETSVNRALQREFTISWEEFAALSTLHRSPHRFLHMTELAAALGFSRSRVSRAISRQESNGHAIRSECPRDARATHATITERGVALLGRMSRTYEATVRDSLTGLSIGAEQIETLVKHLEPLSDQRDRPNSHLRCARPRANGPF